MFTIKMIKKPNNSGWILCPSKSYPGKFYYFNVFNGEAAWSLNGNEKRVNKKGVAIQKIKENHSYPEPITPPDYPSPRGFNYHNTMKTCLPTFGQAIFPKYISNEKEDMAIVCTPIQIRQLVTKTRKTMNQNTQTEQDNINVHNHTIPLTKRFENKINKSFSSISYITAAQPRDWRKSTNIWSNGNQCDTSDVMYKQKCVTKPIIMESKLKELQCKNKIDMSNRSAKQDSTQLLCNKVKNSKAMPNSMLKLDINDLRYVLRAKKGNTVEFPDLYSKEHSTFNDTKVTFNMRGGNTFYAEKKYVSEGATYNENQKAWYLVVDLNILLEDYDIVKSYIDKDVNCRLHIPSVVQNQLRTLCMGEHGGRRRVIVARQLQRQLGSITTRLNLPENKEDSEIHQIINCCLEIIKRSHDVVLVTKDIELTNIAKLYKIKVYHTNDIKSNDLEINVIDTYKHNLFLQNASHFDPFSLSKTIQAPENDCRQNISSTEKSLISDVSYVNENDISDIIINISKLNINDKIINIKRKVENNLFENKTLFHNTSNYKIAERNSKEVTKIISNKKDVNITFNMNKEINKKYLINGTDKDIKTDIERYYTNMCLRKPLNDFNNNIFGDMFKIKNHIMEENIYMRFDEWVCFYEQIIEEFLHIVLQKNLEQLNQPPPWFLHEGLECLKDIYKDNKYIINIIEKMLYYYDFTYENGTNIKPYNFMKLFGCGFYLVEALEKTSPLCISDIKKKLIYLRDTLECPIEDLIVDSPIYHNREDEQTYRYNFVKNPSEVLDYLKKHFSEWKDYNEDYNANHTEQELHRDNIKVLRTYGRDVNKLTINKSKCLSFINETDRQTHNDHQSNDSPKVIRNVKLLDIYEEKIRRNENGLDHQEIAETISSRSIYNENRAIINNVAVNNDIEIVSKNNDSKNDEKSSINDIEYNDSTKDSGFASNSLHAYNLVRNFLSELSSSFKIIHTFIDENIKNYNENITEENKKNLYEKVNKTHTHVTEIIDKLKIIIERESKESSTLKALLIKAGRNDKRTTRYRPVVMKCLEQATILENSLKLMLAITNEELLSVSSEENIRFINIYE